MNNMEKKIAIQGHETRGPEIIRILENLGGENYDGLSGFCCKGVYFVNYDNEIEYKSDKLIDSNEFQVYTLEEYLIIFKQPEQTNNMEKRTVEISLTTAKEWYKGDNDALKNVALQVFTEKELEGITCVRSWEEFITKFNKLEHEYFIDHYSNIKITNNYCKNAKNDRNLLATREDAEAFLALMQLKRLRDQWWEVLNYKPDFVDGTKYKYVIQVYKNKPEVTYSYYYNQFLAFPNRDIAEDFLKCFKDLIEKAKELICIG